MIRPLILLLALGSTPVLAATAPKTYQVTGNVVEVTDNKIVVQKGNEKWDLARDAQTKLSGQTPKVGDKVTIQYVMEAQTVQTKAPASK